MNIEIAERLHPFSMQPGCEFLLPYTSLRVRAYPACVIIDDLASGLAENGISIGWDVTGPVKDFSATQDLERGELRVQGRYTEGYFRYVLHTRANSPDIVLRAERTPASGVFFRIENDGVQTRNGLLQQKEEIDLPGGKMMKDRSTCAIERLSFGNHKKQDWDLIRRRGSLSEIFPLWYRLGQVIPEAPVKGITGTAALLEPCRAAIFSGAPDTIHSSFNALFLAGFEGGLSPRLQDSDRSGIKVGGEMLHFDSHIDLSPLILVNQGAKLIRSLFLQESDGRVKLLPSLPPELACGRLVNASCGVEGRINVEWTKKRLHKVVFAALSDQQVMFDFCRGEVSCRLRRSYNDRGEKYLSGEAIAVKSGEAIWLDCFKN